MKKSKKKCVVKIGILGFGQIGQAISRFYKSPKWNLKIKDLNKDDGLSGVEILHVCIPYGISFFDVVKEEIEKSDPKLVIVHSTTCPGTVKNLNKIFMGKVVHSPVRGVHPNLYGGIKTFVKYIGADNKKFGLAAKKHLEGLGIKTKLLGSSISTELGKAFDTTYYGICIAWHGEMQKICDKMGVDFEETVTDFNKTYNQGYKNLGKANVVRPVLKPPQGFIGGHCVVPNAKILKKIFESKAFDLILDYDGGEKSCHTYKK